MKQHHHLRLTGEMKEDLIMWLKFLDHPSVYCRPFIDITNELQTDIIDFYTDASGRIGMGLCLD